MSFTINILFPICLAIIVYLRTRKLSKSQENLNRQPLEVLYSPASNDPEVDIVAAHGLGSNADWSWVWQDKTGQRRRVHWLKDPDMLPAVVPNARILAYNYESPWHANTPQIRLQLCCESLVQSLDNFYGQESKRPIVFIGHSLGGLVILHGLSYAHSHPKFKYLTDNTIGFISLGTPFQGTDMQPLAQLAARIMAPFDSDWGIIANLGYENTTLRDETHKFGDLVKKLNISTYCFFEQFKTDYGKRFGVPGIIKGMVVKETSACVPAWPRASLQADHLKMNKFAGPEDGGYLAVSAAISKMCKIEEPPLKQVINYLRDKCYTESNLNITRLSGAILSIDQCYINLATINSIQASSRASAQTTPFSLPARQRVTTPHETFQVNLSDIFNSCGESNVTGNPPRRILIRGRAGVGKTTLCKKIVHDFNQSRIWKNLFDCILWIPLRNLKGRNGSGYNIENLLFDEFFVYAGNTLGRRFATEIDALRPHKSVLFILDGWDEVAQPAETDQDMFAFLKELLNLPNVIITSRPSASLPPGVHVHLELETIGFYPEQVDEYIMNSRTECPDEIKAFLQSNQLVQSLARIPIQLDALCYCWKDIEAHHEDVMPRTMTWLYQAIQTSLWRKDIPRLKLKSVDGELIGASDIGNADQPRIEDLVQRQLHFLEHLAFNGLIYDIVEFGPKHLNPVNNDGDHCLLLDSILPHLSFLRTSNPSAQYSDQSCHFIHLTFQEYFAARYFARQWTRDSDLKGLMCEPRKDFKPTEFLAKYKYDQRFNIMWRFAAGLLDVLDDDGDHQATRFLKKIEEQPRDLFGPAHQRLVMHCLSEVVSSEGSDFSTYREHLEDILAQWLSIECSCATQSCLAAEPEFPEKALEKGLKQVSDGTRTKIIMDLIERRAPHAALNTALSFLDDSNVSKDLKERILYTIKWMDLPFTENDIRSVVAQLEEEKLPLREYAWLALLSQRALSNEITILIEKFKKEDIKLRARLLGLMALKSIQTEEVVPLVATQLEDSALPQDMRLIAAQFQDQSFHLKARPYEEVDAIRVISELRVSTLRILRQYSAFPIQKISWLEEQLRACNRIDRALRRYKGSSYHNERELALHYNMSLSYEVLQALQEFDLSGEAQVLVAQQLNADDDEINRWVFQILGKWSDLSKEILLLVVKQLKNSNTTMANEALQILRDQSSLSKEVLHALAELSTLGFLSDEINDEHGKKIEI
ncbi:hypothetical protein MKX08_002300 [Trichoderma sp. CBMAI-0020]|nr:hypothetical protein MKX08_002300 [Trichoderma sp. CBMAI-0020]